MRIAIGCDHRGLNLKQAVKQYLEEQGHQYHDFGCHGPASVDYPDIAQPVAEAVGRGEADHGILICSTGIGMSIAANKVPGVRAAVCSDTFSARRAREHNDANVLCFGEGVVSPGLAQALVEAYLTAQFQGDRHSRRVEKIKAIEQHHKPQQHA